MLASKFIFAAIIRCSSLLLITHAVHAQKSYQKRPPYRSTQYRPKRMQPLLLAVSLLFGAAMPSSVFAQANISLSKALTSETGAVVGRAESGEVLTYTITLTNSGTADGAISVTETVPVGTTYFGGDDFSAACTVGDPAGTSCVATSPNVPAGESATMEFSVRADQIITPSSIENVVIETGDTPPVCTRANNADPRCVSAVKQCTTLADVFAAPGDRVTISGIRVTASRGRAGSGSHAGNSGGVTSGTFTRIATNSVRTIDDNTFARGFRDYIYHRISFSQPILLEAPISMNDIDGLFRTNDRSTTEIVAIIGGNNGAYVAPNYTTPVANGPTIGTRRSTRDPVGLNHGGNFRVAIARNVADIPFTAARGIVRATFPAPITDAYFALGLSRRNTTTQNRMSGVSNFCMEDVLPRLSVSKTLVSESINADGIAQAGEILTYAVTVNNNGGAAPATVTETVPVGTIKVAGDDFDSACADQSPAGTACQLNFGTIPALGSVTRQFTVEVIDPIDTATKSINNVVILSGETPPNCTVDDNADPRCVVIPTGPNINLAKTLTGESINVNGIAEAGETLTYTITLSNTGGQAGTIAVSETVPAGTTYAGSDDFTNVCSVDDPAATVCTETSPVVPIDGTATMTFSVTVDDPINVASINNVVIEQGEIPPNCTPTNNADPRCVVTPTESRIIVSKTLTTGAPTAQAGEDLSFRINVQNIGGTSTTIAAGGVTETVPANTSAAGGDSFSCADGDAATTTCTSIAAITLAPGTNQSLNFDVTVDNPIPNNVLSIANTVTVTGVDCTETVQDCGEEIPTEAKLFVAKTLTTGGPVIAAGENLTFNIAISNVGGATAAIPAGGVSETVPANTTASGNDGFSCADGDAATTVCTNTAAIAIQSNSVENLSFNVTVDDPLPIDVTNIANSVTVTGIDCSATDQDCGEETPTEAKLVVTKTLSAGGPSADAGEELTFNIAIRNAGGTLTTLPIGGVTETVPVNTTASGNDSFSCSDGDAAATSCANTAAIVLAPNVSQSLSFNVAVDDPIPAGVLNIANTVAVTGVDCTEVGQDCGEEVPTQARLVVTKTLSAGGPTVEAGEALTFTIAISNIGGTAATLAIGSVTETVPANTTAAGGDDFGCADGDAPTTTCTNTAAITVAGGAVQNLTFNVTADDPLPNNVTSIANSVTVTGVDCTQTDQDCGEETPTEAKLIVTKTLTTGGATAQAGEDLTFAIGIRNAGGTAITIAAGGVTETVPANTTAGGNDNFSCTDGDAAATNCTSTAQIPLAPGVSQSLTFNVTVDDPIPNGVLNIANTVAVNGVDCTQASQDCEEELPTEPKLIVAKTLTTGGPVLEAGQDIVYTIGISNVGGEAISLPVNSVTETVPQNTTAGGGDDFSCSDDDSSGTICTNTAAINLAGGSSDALTFNVTVDDPLPIGVANILNTVTVTGVDCSQADQDCSEDPPVDNPSISILKTLAGPPIRLDDSTFRITYNLRIVNTGTSPILNVQIEDDLNAMKDRPVPNNGVVSDAVVSYVSGTVLTPNNGYTGTGVNDMLLGTEAFPVGAQTDLSLSLSFTPDVYFGPFNNISTAQGVSSTNKQLIDDSDAEFSLDTPSTPISLGWFYTALNNDETVDITWQTAAEVGNAGFSLFGVNSNDERTPLTDQLVPSQGDSDGAQLYQFTSKQVFAQYMLVDHSVMGSVTYHGPFELGSHFGSPVQKQSIEWDAIKRESEQNKIDREKRRKQELERRFEKLKQSSKTGGDNKPLSVINQLGKASQAIVLGLLNAFIPAAHGADLVVFEISAPGIYHVAHQALLDAGLNLTGVDVSRIGLMQDNELWPLMIENTDNGVFTSDSTIEFPAVGLDSLYSGINKYTLVLDEGQRLIQDDNRPLPTDIAFANSYFGEQRYAPQNEYSLLSPEDGDPWFAHTLRAFRSNAAETITFSVDDYAPALNGFNAFGPNNRLRREEIKNPELNITVWGGSDLPGNGVDSPDHLVQISNATEQLASIRFDGIRSQTKTIALPRINNGSNRFTLTVPSRDDVLFDLVRLDEVVLRYPRHLRARNGALVFNSAWGKFRALGLNPSSTTVLRLDDNNNVYRMTNRGDQACGSNCVFFAGGDSNNDNTFFVAEHGTTKTPGITSAITSNISLTKQVAYLVIAHPDFIGNTGGALENYVAELASQYGSAELVDVEQIYANYSGGILDPLAIKDYIADAYVNQNTDHVLLVGGDNYDYRNFTGSGGQSFIPSIYMPIANNVRSVPSDASYVLIDDDLVPDLTIARLPVRTREDLTDLISKRNAFLGLNGNDNILIAADNVDSSNYSFRDVADNLTSRHFARNNVTTSYLDDLSVAQARSAIINSFNAGAKLAAYFGHSSPNRWSTSNIFDGQNVADLTNFGSPAVITQWGCWNTFYASPDNESLANHFLLDGRAGAVTVMGATSFTNADAEARMADFLFANLRQGMTIGNAVLRAKEQIARTTPHQLDILLGWAVLGFDDMTVFEQ